MTTEDISSLNRRQGYIKKCPSCGAELKALSSTCEECGHELAGVTASGIVIEIAERFLEIESQVDGLGLLGKKREDEITRRKGRLIRDYPIPNSREDLLSLIYFIYPKVQNNLKVDPNLEDWRVKFKEVMLLAKNSYKGDANKRGELEELERALQTTMSDDLKASVSRNPLIAIGLGIAIIAAVAGLAFTQIEKWNQVQCEKRYESGSNTEKVRLEGLVASILVKQKAKQYDEALADLNVIRWTHKETCKQELTVQETTRWDARKTELMNQIRQAKEQELAQIKSVADAAAAEKAEAQAKSAIARKKAASDKDW